MLILRNPAQCSQVADAAVRALALLRMELLCDGEDESVLGPLVVMEAGDAAERLQEPLGSSVFDIRFEVIEEHPCCFELVFVMSDDGAGALVLVPKGIDLDPKLLELCRQFAIPSRETLQ